VIETLRFNVSLEFPADIIDAFTASSCSIVDPFNGGFLSPREDVGFQSAHDVFDNILFVLSQHQYIIVLFVAVTVRIFIAFEFDGLAFVEFNFRKLLADYFLLLLN
jgi:hypothetical protein